MASCFAQGGFWAHMHVAVGSAQIPITSSLVFMMSFLAFFSIVIALFKDIPDVRGDAGHAIKTATVRFGVERIFWVCIWMLYAAYSSAIAYIGVTMSGVERIALMASQVAMIALLRQRALETNLASHPSIVATYMFIWKLFYAQYLLFPMLA
jgi:homogentisate phytyltransferase / homogentisate geranylgeranyltransferase